MSEESVPSTSRLARFLAFWIVGPFLVLAIGIVALVRNPPQSLLLDILATQVRHQTGYQLSVGTGSSITLWPEARLDLRDAKLRRPTVRATRGGVVADAVRLTANFNVRNWLKGDRTIDTMRIEKPTVTLFDADLRQLKAATGARSAGVQLRHLTIDDGFVSYYVRPANPEFSVSKFKATLTDLKSGHIGQLKGRFVWRDATVKMSGSMSRGGAKHSTLAVDLKAPTAKIAFNGAVYDDATTRIEGEANIRITSIDEFARWLNIDHGPEHPALSGRATIVGPVALSTKQIWLKGANVTTAIAAGKVDVAVDWRGNRPRITGEAAWTKLDLNAFTTSKPTLASFAVAPARIKADVTIPSAWQSLDTYLETLTGPMASRSLAPTRRLSPAPPPPGKSPVQPITLDFGLANIGDVVLLQTAQTLRIAGLEFADVTLDSQLDAGRIILDVAQARFAGGQWAGKLRIDGRSAAPEHALSLTGKQVDVKKLLVLLDAPETIEGRSSFTASLSARGNSLDKVVDSISGKADLGLSKGRLIGFDLKAVLNQWWRKWSYDTRRATPFNKVRARLRLNKGVIKTIGPVTLRGRHVEVDSNGTVSLGRRHLDQRVRARLAPPPSQLPIPVRISGPWTKPVITLDFGLFSLAPGRYDMPFALDQIPSSRRTRSLAPVPGADMPAPLREKVRQLLEDPAQAGKLPAKLRTQLDRLAR